MNRVLCVGCARVHIPEGQPYNRCDACRKTKEREKSRHRRRTVAERKRRQELVAEHVRLNGWVCPGWNRSPHPSTDLTADHIVPQAKGAAPESAIRVLCRRCNGSRGDGSTTKRDYEPRPRFSRQTLTNVQEGDGGPSKDQAPRLPPPGSRETNSAGLRRGQTVARRLRACSYD
jgi:5-methylcytosine-specific restriction endonuclease McrA